MAPSAALRIPSATYRVQMNRNFTFRDASKVVSYLHALGISDLYCSPYFKATPGSLHGYDLVDPTVLNPEIGSEEEYRDLVQELRMRDMGQLLDVVPNHMGIGRDINQWWLDVLENGPGSNYARFFDIDWDPIKDELKDKVLLPILGDQYGAVLENQELRLSFEEGRFLLNYYERRLPVAPKSWVLILSHGLDALIQRVGAADPYVMELQSILTALRNLPSRNERDPKLVEERYREKEIVKRRLRVLVETSHTIRSYIDQALTTFNGTKGVPASFDLLDALLNDQAYRLAYWRVAAEEINYRRFFDINELAAIKMEDETVFREAHKLVFRLVQEGAVTGLRIDHVDGLYDPAEYLRTLQVWAQTQFPDAVDVQGRALYVVVEKILGADEAFPESWSVHGTTGYDFLAVLNGLFVACGNERAFDDLYARVIGERLNLDELSYRSKQLIMKASMASELNVLGHELNRLSEKNRRSRDFTLNSLTHAIREIIACFPVYRTYITGGSSGVSERDRAFIRLAVAKAKRRNPAVSGLVFDFVRDLLCGAVEQPAPGDQQERARVATQLEAVPGPVTVSERLQFVMKFQQTTSPVTAKGIEDTTFYIFNRLVSLNEVGSDPKHFGTAPGAVHKWMKNRRARWPGALSATSTHDTKRSEDIRARINVLSELPAEWKTAVLAWSKLNKKFKTEVEGESAPDRNDEYLLYQTLIGAWPFSMDEEQERRDFEGRIQAYMNKAIKEAKVHTSWVNQNQEYEDAVKRFIEAVLSPLGQNLFLEQFVPFQRRVAEYGLYNGLGQVVVKLMAPGVPDLYQGTELWDLSLVDPDNRRPVDYALRSRLLAEIQKASDDETAQIGLSRELLEHRSDGRIKLYVTTRLLQYRRSNPALFQDGDYIALTTFGKKADHVFAFARMHAEGAVVVAIPRLLTGVMPEPTTLPMGTDVWEDTRVITPAWREGTSYQNLLTGERLVTETNGEHQVLAVGDIFRQLPVAVLERQA